MSCHEAPDWRTGSVLTDTISARLKWVKICRNSWKYRAHMVTFYDEMRSNFHEFRNKFACNYFRNRTCSFVSVSWKYTKYLVTFSEDDRPPIACSVIASHKHKRFLNILYLSAQKKIAESFPWQTEELVKTQVLFLKKPLEKEKEYRSTFIILYKIAQN